MLELAVVLSIIGILIGALFATRSLLRTSQLNQIISEYSMYVQAIKEFQDKYYALPGDMKNAEAIWGSDASCPNTPFNSVTKTATCNGDGNGRIGSSSTIGIVSNSREWWRAWQQLSNSGLINKKYTGAPASAADRGARLTINVPASEVDNAGWTLMYFITPNSNVFIWSDMFGNVLSFGAPPATADERTWVGVLTPSEAFSVDTKSDDAKSGTGFIRAWGTTIGSCVTNDSSQIAQYYSISGTTSKVCALLFIPGL